MLRTASSTSFSMRTLQLFIILLLLHCKIGACDGLEAHHQNNSNTTTTSSSSLSVDINEPYQHLQGYYEAKLAPVPIQGIRKMSPDPGEKFFFEYYHFIDDDTINKMNNETVVGTATARRLYPLHAALPSSGNEDDETLPIPMLRFHGRSFQCPAGTRSCASINRPDRCCNDGDTCELVNQNNGGGAVGCCPAGQTCSGVIGSCQVGYTTCSQSLGGGCCIPGYECVEGGCAYITTETVTVQTSVFVSTSTVIVSTSTSASSTTSGSTSSTSTSTPTTSSTGSLIPPARPTSLSISTTSQSTTSSSTSLVISACPTGFYACSAVYQGGCCQTGRNCDTTSCPATASTTIVSEHRTIVVPVVTETAAPPSAGGGNAGGRCASGWFSCADTVGGGCCPTGFVCGASCTAAITGSPTGTLAKEIPTANGGGSLQKKGQGLWLSWLPVMVCIVLGLMLGVE